MKKVIAVTNCCGDCIYASAEECDGPGGSREGSEIYGDTQACGCFEARMPKRIQLKRTKGWRMPANTVKVCRPGRWGNPFRIGGWFMVGDPLGARAGALSMSWCEAAQPNEPGFTLIDSQERAVEFFEREAAGWPEAYLARAVAELRGKNLACWCKEGTPCHVDVLLKLVNPG